MTAIVAFRPEHTDDVVATVKAVYDEYGFGWHPEDYHADLFRIAEEYAAPDHGFWVAEHDGKAVACAGLVTFPKLGGDVGSTVLHEGVVRVAGADCEIVRLYVHPDFRRLGLGRALTLKVVDEARQRNRTVMEIWTDKEFLAAHRLYEALGAKTVGERLCHDPAQSPEFGMALLLQP